MAESEKHWPCRRQARCVRVGTRIVLLVVVVLLAGVGSAHASSIFFSPDGSGETVNPYNSSMQVDNQFFTRLDDAGDRMTSPDKCSYSSLDF